MVEKSYCNETSVATSHDEIQTDKNRQLKLGSKWVHGILYLIV